MPVFRLTPYMRGMRNMGIDEAEMGDIEAEIVANPTHPMIPGLKGARKARIQRPGMGKRGGGRVIYYLATLGTERFCMMAAYPKSERDDLSTEQRRRILAALESIKKQGR